MPELSRAQIVVYGAIAVALLLVGARAIRAEGGAERVRSPAGLGRPSRPAAAASASAARRPTSSSTSTGAVARPGVYRLPAGSRVDGRGRAGRRRQRQGRAGSDQPRRPARRRAAGGGARTRARRAPRAATGGGDEDGPISLGTATVEQLDTIDGIGPVTAAGHRRVPRPARRPLLGRPARPGLAGSGRRRWSRCAPGCSPEAAGALAAAVAAGPARDRRPGRARARPQRRDPRAGRGRPRAGHAGPRGGAGPRLRARRGRGDRRRGPRRTSAAPGSATCSRSRGQNVTLLALLAMPLLAALGIPLRERLVWVLGLIAVYVPLAGAGPSIQRAGGDGRGRACWRRWPGAAPRASTRWLLALGVTLAIDPGDRRRRRLAAQLRRGARDPRCWPRRCARRSRRGSARGGWRRALAEGAAVTIAATLATAPLIAFHFEDALDHDPASPTCWRCRRWRRRCGWGWSTAGAAQVPGFPVEPLNGLNALLLAYIAQVAAWCAAPELGRGRRPPRRRRPARLLPGLARGVAVAVRLARRRRLRRARTARPTGRARRVGVAARRPLRGALRGGCVLALAWAGAGRRRSAAPPVPACGSTVLDVGQGDAILLQPARRPGGPGRRRAAGRRPRRRSCEEAGVERLGAAIVTHDQSDHAGGIEELLGRFPIARLVYARLGRRLLAAARRRRRRPDAGRRGQRAALRRACASRSSGRRRSCSPNRSPAPTRTSWRWSCSPAGATSRCCSRADAEAEAVPLDPGPVDVLKVAHHGSDDAGLGGAARPHPRRGWR